MKRFGLLTALGATALALAVGGCSQPAEPYLAPASESPLSKIRTAPESQQRIPDSYIVVLRESVDDVDAVVNELSNKDGIASDNVYKHAIKGFSAKLSPGQLRKLVGDPRVDFVEPDILVTTCVQTIPYGIDNVDADVSSTLAGNGSGAVTGVRVYVIDTGIQLNHPDLNVVGSVNFTTNKRNATGNDDNGHGTHVAGTIGARDNTSQVVGVAPGVPLYAVKVLAANGSGSLSNIVRGIDYVTAQKQASPSTPMVANMSLGAYVGTTAYGSMDLAVVNSISKGVFYSLAAGNNASNASGFSPAHTTEAFTVGAYNSSNVFATSFSNYGAVVDMNAPGVNVLSTYRNGGTATMSGTSMAAPHVAGVAALYLSSNPGASPATVASALVSSSTNNASSRVTSAPAETTNLAVYAGAY